MRRQSLETIALLILLAIVGLRPLIGQTYSTARTDVSAALPGMSDPWAATTLILDAVILIVAAVVLMRRQLHGSRRYVVCGLELGAALLLVSAAVACVLAGRQRVAINASIDLLSMIVGAIVLVQLLDAGWKLRLALAIVVASGAANAAECFDQHFYTFKATEEEYNRQREAMWTSQGVALDSAEVKLFEQRMKAREADGYFAHSNVAGGYMLLAGLAALGAGIGASRGWRGRRRWLAAVCGVGLGGLVGYAVALTHSVGAMAAGIAAVVLVGVRLVFAGALARRRRQVFVVCWIVIIGGALGVVGLGLINHGLPGSSLDFRWQYWTASAKMFRDHLAGVGPQNFGDHYLQYKSIASPEEVKNPHNFVVQFATELGISGTIALVLLIGGGVLALTRPVDWHESAMLRTRGSDETRPFEWLLTRGALLGVVIFLVRIPLLPSSQPAFVVWATGFPLLVWLGALGLALVALWFASTSAKGIATLAACVNAALFAFLLQDTVNFALFTPGAPMAFFTLLAVSVAVRSPGLTEREPQAQDGGRVGLAIAGAFAVCLVIALAPPVRAEYDLRAARALSAQTGEAGQAGRWRQADVLYRAAIAADPLDSTAPAEYAKWLIATAPADDADQQLQHYREAQNALHTAVQRDRYSFSLYRRTARVDMLVGRLEHDKAEYQQAIASMREAIRLYPTRPMSYVELGDCQMAVGGSQELRSALRNFERALALDARRPDWERFRRLSSRQIDEIRERIERVKALLEEHQAPPS